MAVVLGRLLGAAFLICFGTGLYSHFLQEPLAGMRFATQPSTLYQLTQGIHITAGIACVPLLLGKLYTVFPELFQTPPLRGLLHLLERASIAVFVGSSLVQVTIGLLNTYQWYPWPFGFREVHFALSFVIIGSLAIHIGVKLPVITRYWTRRRAVLAEQEDSAAEVPAGHPDDHAPARGVLGRVQRWIDDTPPEQPEVSRRALLAVVGLSTAAAVVLTAGQSFRVLAPLNLLGPRAMGVGPQGLPINRTAAAAQVTETAVAPDWALTVVNSGSERRFSRADLLAMPQTQVELPIACVEGWSQMATWRGVRVKELVGMVGAGSTAGLTVTSLEKEGGYRVTQMGGEYVDDDTTLVALELNGETLDIDHGFPARIIAPGRPGVLQTKWLSSLEVNP
jgi:hypothetical protein